ncbi:hypothetical protein KUTeg_015758, partial [Tegillarca granosa]
ARWTAQTKVVLNNTILGTYILSLGSQLSLGKFLPQVVIYALDRFSLILQKQVLLLPPSVAIAVLESRTHTSNISDKSPLCCIRSPFLLNTANLLPPNSGISNLSSGPKVPWIPIFHWLLLPVLSLDHIYDDEWPRTLHNKAVCGLCKMLQHFSLCDFYTSVMV